MFDVMKSMWRFVLLLSVLLLSGCGEEIVDIMEKKTSPDGKAEVTVYRVSEGGATVPYFFTVYLILHKEDGDKRILVFEGAKFMKIHPRWVNNTTVLIEYDAVRVGTFRNFIYDDENVYLIHLCYIGSFN